MSYTPHHAGMNDAQSYDDRDDPDPDPEGQVDIGFSEQCCSHL